MKSSKVSDISYMKILRRICMVVLSVILPDVVMAQTETSASNLETLLIVVIVILMVVSVLVLVVAIYTLYVLRTILIGEKERKAREKGEETGAAESYWERISKSLTRSTPVAEEESILMDHEFDGIKELDNHLPPWWKALFFLSIVWAAIYLMAFHVFDIFPLSREEYNREIMRAEAVLEARQALVAESIDETNVTFTDDPQALANGETIFNAQCAVCHASDGGGGVGPNMTDDYYIHGGSIQDIFRTIKYGVPEKGMISWQSQLPPSDMRDVASYVMTLRGTTPVNPKEPQGERYIPEDSGEIPDSLSSENQFTISMAR